MARAMTKQVSTRRSAILDELKAHGTRTGDQLREYLARQKSIYVTVDTVMVDLRVMMEVGTVQRTRYLRSGYWVWSLVEGRWHG